ncbi:right-handed parallel beta-helix repeat-containing protein [Marinobacter sp. JSM 1782161]|uniref:right-handed parallel beta-helix repeat-containing protein n=1 Tax=Marinobacter sp. JSM 1782161 TaxID=2685906 RepID=UPI001A9F078B|nr:right-handed parallel beta-helix repeat-containing protein [Marinobacter sp. JSM 1782161]
MRANPVRAFRLRTIQPLLATLLVTAVLASSAHAEGDCDRLVRAGDSLQAAFDGLPDDGSQQTVCLTDGTFQLTDMVTLTRDNVTLRGRGLNDSVLQMAEGVSSPVLVLGDAYHQQPQQPIRNVTVEELGIEGGGQTPNEFRPDLPYLSNSALVVRQGEGILLRNLNVQDCRSACLLTEYHSRDVTIEGSHVSRAQWDGISLNRAGPTRIHGNTIEDNVAAGITVEYLEGSEISNNVIANNGSHGLYLADAENNRFAGNLIRDNHLAGVFLTCSVRDRNPVLCWEDSFSRGNEFVDNRFEHNHFGYQVAVDSAANCKDFDNPPNVSRGDAFVDSPNEEPDWGTYGRCLAYDGSQTLEHISRRDTRGSAAGQ